MDKIQPSIDFISQAAKVVKPGINLAASAAPLHTSVPIAPIKAVLGVFVFFRDQMERLLSAVEIAMYLLKQLGLYFEHFLQVESTSLAKDLEVVASSYSLVLAFLATGHRAHTKKRSKRVRELLWSSDKVGEFEQGCKTAVTKLEMAANHCNRDGSQTEFSYVKKGVDVALNEMKKPDIVVANTFNSAGTLWYGKST